MAKDGQRSYTDAEREAALKLYTEVGPAEAGRQTGIPAGTIKSWARRANLSDARRSAVEAQIEAARLTWAQRKAEVARASGEVAAEALEAIRAAIRAGKARVASDFSRAYAVAVDKAQLLDGGATGRLELSESELRAQVRQLRDELAAQHADELAAKREKRQAAGA